MKYQNLNFEVFVSSFFAFLSIYICVNNSLVHAFIQYVLGRLAMRQTRQLLIVIATLVLLLELPVAGESLSSSIDRELATLNSGKDRAKEAVFGVKIVLADNGTMLYEQNARSTLVPASNSKLIATAAAMAALGPQFQFKTLFGILDNDLVVIGAGDPSLGDAQMCGDEPITAIFDRLAEQLLARKITRISGRLIVDISAFEATYRHENWPANQRDKWYEAPVAALNFNDNCVDLAAGSDGNQGGWLKIIPDGRFIRQQTRFIPGKRRMTIIDSHWEENWTLVTNVNVGDLAAGPISLPIDDPPRFFAQLLQQQLLDKGIEIAGPIVFQKIIKPDGGLPEKFTPILEHRSRNLGEIIQRTNQNSQNLFAECLFKRIGLEFSRQLGGEGPVGSWKTGRMAAHCFLQDKVGFDVAGSGLVIDDGSGLSPANRISPDCLASVLYHATRQPWASDFVASLASPGEDGTLRNRMKGTLADDRIRAKTGYISGASTLSGYVADGRGHVRILFSMIFNNFARGQLWRVLQVQDKICIKLAAYADGLEPLEENVH